MGDADADAETDTDTEMEREERDNRDKIKHTNKNNTAQEGGRGRQGGKTRKQITKPVKKPVQTQEHEAPTSDLHRSGIVCNVDCHNHASDKKQQEHD